MTKLDVGLPELNVGMMDLGDWLCRYAYGQGLSSLTTRQRKAAGGFLFSAGPRVVSLLAHAMEQPQYADLFTRVPFTAPELRRRQERVADLRSLRLALMFLLERVNDTRLQEESELNRLALMVLKSAQQQAADPFADPGHLLRLSAALAHVQQALAGRRGPRRRARQRVIYRYGAHRRPGACRASASQAPAPVQAQTDHRPAPVPDTCPQSSGSGDAGGGPDGAAGSASDAGPASGPTCGERRSAAHGERPAARPEPPPTERRAPAALEPPAAAHPPAPSSTVRSPAQARERRASMISRRPSQGSRPARVHFPLPCTGGP